LVSETAETECFFAAFVKPNMIVLTKERSPNRILHRTTCQPPVWEIEKSDSEALLDFNAIAEVVVAIQGPRSRIC
jgi:hypothetical protein